MPITRPLTPEEDITMSIGTTISGLVAKYNSRIDAKALIGSMLANMALGCNELIDSSTMTFTEKAVLRGDLKTLCGRALRAKLGVVDAGGKIMDADKLDAAVEAGKEEPGK